MRRAAWALAAALLLAAPGVGVRRGRVRFVAVAASSLLRNRRGLRAHLRYARLR